MSVTVSVSPTLEPVLGGNEWVVTKGRPTDVGEALELLFESKPAMRDRLMDHGELRRYVKIRIGGHEIWDLAGLKTSLRGNETVEIDLPARAKVTFVQEHRVVETEPGRTIKEIALEAGIDPNRKYQRLVSCEGLGIFDGCKCWVKAEKADALSPRSWTERALHALTGWQRLACQARVYGDVEVWTMPQGDERLREPRPIAPPPPKPAKRERPLESIFRSPAPDDEEGDAETAPAAKKMPTDTKAPVQGIMPGAAVPVDVPKAVAAANAVPVPDAVDKAVDEAKIAEKLAHGTIQNEPPNALAAKPKSTPPAANVVGGAEAAPVVPAAESPKPAADSVDAAKEVAAREAAVQKSEPPKKPSVAPASGSGKISPDDTGSVKVAVVAPIVKPVSSPPPYENPVDRPARDHEPPSEGARTAEAEGEEDPAPSGKA